MKLCRFELVADPGVARSGLYHDGRFYETDGESAVGIHDPGSVRLFAPIGTAPCLRLFEDARDASGQPFLTYAFGNPARMLGPNTEIPAGLSDEELDFDVRVGVITQETAAGIDPFEAQRLVLGYGIVLSFYEPGSVEMLAELGVSDAPSRDVGWLFGPFLVTPDELLEHRAGPDPLQFGWSLTVQVNSETVFETVQALPSFGTMLGIASSKGPVFAGEVVASPPMAKPLLPETGLGRFLVATDKVSVSVEPLGTLVARVG